MAFNLIILFTLKTCYKLEKNLFLCEYPSFINESNKENMKKMSIKIYYSKNLIEYVSLG